MNQAIVQSNKGITLVGGGPVGAAQLRAALALAPMVVAADGGARRAMALGARPQAVIGDLDSLDAGTRAVLPEGALHRIDEQETTDFDKALRHVAAPFVIGLGFWGARMDHALAALNVLARHPDRRCLLMGGRELCFLCPPELVLRRPAGSRISLYPLTESEVESDGLRWPTDGLRLAPDGRVGTSNQAVAPVQRLRMRKGRLLVILPAGALAGAVRALVPGA